MHNNLGQRTSRAGVVLAGVVVALSAGAGTAWASSATGTPTTVTRDGQPIAVKGTGFGPGLDVVLIQCSGATPTACDTGHVVMAKSDASGNVSATFKAALGKVGDGTCVAGSTNCFIAVTDIAGSTPTAVKLTYPKASTTTQPTSTPPTSTRPSTTSKTPTKTLTKTTTGRTKTGAKATAGSGLTLGSGNVSQPTTVAAGSGGLVSDGHGNLPLALAIAVGGTALAAGTLLCSRRAQS